MGSDIVQSLTEDTWGGEVYWRDKSVRDRLSFALQHDEVYKDIEFLVGKQEEKIPAHKLILRLSSMVFENLIRNHEEQGFKEIRLPNTNAKMFKRLLKFIYTDELEMNEFSQFLAVAKDFGFKRLSDQSVKIMKKTAITVKNAGLILDLAMGLGEEELERKSLSFILKNAKDIILAREFVYLPYSILGRILLEDGVGLDELSIMKAVLRWGKFNCKVKGIDETPENVRGILKDVRLYIRYTLMTYDLLISDVKSSELLTQTEFLQVLKTYVDPDSNPLGLTLTKRTAPVSSLGKVAPLPPKLNLPAPRPYESSHSSVPFSYETSRPMQLSYSSSAPQPVPAPVVYPSMVPPPVSYAPTLSSAGPNNSMPSTSNSNNGLSSEMSALVEQQISLLNEKQQRAPFVPIQITDADVFQLSTCMIEFGDLLNTVQLQFTVKHIILHEIDLRHTMSLNRTRVFLPNLELFHFFQSPDLTGLPDKSFLNGLSTYDFLFFDKRSEFSWTYNELWWLGVHIRIDVKGLLLMDLDPFNKSLTLAYPVQQEFDQIVQGMQKEMDLKELCLTSCTMTFHKLLCCRSLVKLVLQGVSFPEGNVLDFLNKCKVKTLSVFATDGFELNINTDMRTKKHRKHLVKMALSKVHVKASPKAPMAVLPWTKLEELYLDVCTWNSSFTNSLEQCFPKLTRVAIRSKDAKRVNCAFLWHLLQLPTLQVIAIFRYSGQEDTHNKANINVFQPSNSRLRLEVLELLTKLGMPMSMDYVPDFILEKNTATNLWKAVWDPGQALDEIHFRCSELSSFFTNLTTSKLVQ